MNLRIEFIANRIASHDIHRDNKIAILMRILGTLESLERHGKVPDEVAQAIERAVESVIGEP